MVTRLFINHQSGPALSTSSPFNIGREEKMELKGVICDTAMTVLKVLSVVIEKKRMLYPVPITVWKRKLLEAIQRWPTQASIIFYLESMFSHQKEPFTYSVVV